MDKFKQQCRDRMQFQVLGDRGEFYEMPEIDIPMSVTCLIFTSGSIECREQAENCNLRMRDLGWRSFIVQAQNPADWAPTSWKAGCKASQAWNSVIMPKVLRAVEALREGERLAVAEDSAWPTTACTPGHVQNVHSHCPPDTGLWLGASRGCFKYHVSIGHREEVSVVCNAPAGCKLISGTATFWRRVNEMFLKVNKDYTSDSIFQFLTGIGLVSVVEPFLAISSGHWSDRTHGWEDRSYLIGECKPKLRPMSILGDLPGLKHP